MDEPAAFLSLVLGLGIAAQWVAWKLRFPSILILLASGFVLGNVCGDNPDVPGSSISDEVLTTRLLFPLVSMAVGVIMLEGGMTLRFHELAAEGRTVFQLVSVGAIVTWVTASFLAHSVAGLGGRVAALLGAILVVTGPTVIGPLLRHVRPNRRVSSILKWEGIVIDPIGAVLAVLVFQSIAHGLTYATLGLLLRITAIGLVIGLGIAWILVSFMQRYLIPDFLHNPVLLATAMVAFTMSNHWAPESGLLTVTVLGVALANQRLVAVRHLLEFKENLRVLLISCLFLVLAARIRWPDLVDLGW